MVEDIEQVATSDHSGRRNNAAGTGAIGERLAVYRRVDTDNASNGLLTVVLTSHHRFGRFSPPGFTLRFDRGTFVTTVTNRGNNLADTSDRVTASNDAQAPNHHLWAVLQSTSNANIADQSQREAALRYEGGFANFASTTLSNGDRRDNPFDPDVMFRVLMPNTYLENGYGYFAYVMSVLYGDFSGIMDIALIQDN